MKPDFHDQSRSDKTGMADVHASAPQPRCRAHSEESCWPVSACSALPPAPIGLSVSQLLPFSSKSHSTAGGRLTRSNKSEELMNCVTGHTHTHTPEARNQFMH